MFIYVDCDDRRYNILSSGLNGSRLGGGGSGLKRLSESLTRRTPSKTPRRSPSRNGSKSPGRDGGVITPGRKTPGGGDRFIPNRFTTDFEASHFKIVRDGQQSVESEIMSPSKREYQRVIQENLGADLSTTRLGIIKPKA